jgi:penicillin-binding protein 1C
MTLERSILTSFPTGGTRRPSAAQHKSQARGARALPALKLLTLAIALLAGSGLGALWAAAWWLGEPPLASAGETSTVVVDRKQRLLRAFTTEDGRWRLPVDHAQVDERYLRMLIAFEDRRFRSHAGVDPIAIGRAAWQLARNGRIVSGASTLSMQTARLIEGRHQRTGGGKLRQMVRAIQLERRLTKEQILDLYLRLAPFGGNLEGVRAASLTYFGKEPRRLSAAEAALLVALPQAPELRRPDRSSEAARRARNRVLDRMAAARVVSSEDAEHAKAERVPTVRGEFPKLAPHLAESERTADPAATVHRLTLDREIQSAFESLARERVATLGSRLSLAILAVDHASGEVLAHVGSADYADETRFGGIDMVRAVRSPGSALKPFIYGLAFEQGLAHPETLIEDRPVRFGSWAPKNFDEAFHGTVTMREALQQSLNVPAVKVLAEVRPQMLVGRFRRLRMVTALPDSSQPSLAIALGGVGMRLSDLTGLYASLARGGEAVRLIHRQEDRGSDRTGAGHEVDSVDRVDNVDLVARRSVMRLPGSTRSTLRPQPSRPVLLSPAAAWYVADILAGTPPPESAKGGGIAYKTGTSYGFRDAWAVGFDGRTTIAVWVGRPDGAATPSLTGRTAAAPILFDAFQRLGRPLQPLPPAPRSAVAERGAALPPPLRRFRVANEEAAPGGPVDAPLQIAFPPDKSELEPDEEDGRSRLVLKAEGGALPLTWLADGKPLASEAHSREAVLEPEGKGFVRLTVIDARGRVDRVTVRVR